METREEVQHGIEGLAAESLITQRLKDELAQIDDAIAASPQGQHRAQLQELLQVSQQTAKELREAVDRSALVTYLTEGNKKPHPDGGPAIPEGEGPSPNEALFRRRSGDDPLF